jgi:hypothetical protein
MLMGAPRAGRVRGSMIPRPLSSEPATFPHRALRIAGAAAALGVAIAASHALADVYKCKGEGGAPVYQEMPCPPGRELRNFQVDPPEITVLPAPPRGGAAAPPPAAARPGNDAKPEKARSAPAAKAGGAPAERRHVHSGMTEGEVLARLGSPDVTSGAKNAKQRRWTWLPVEGDPETITTLTLADGVVTNVERRTVKK